MAAALAAAPTWLVVLAAIGAVYTVALVAGALTYGIGVWSGDDAMRADAHARGGV